MKTLILLICVLCLTSFVSCRSIKKKSKIGRAAQLLNNSNKDKDDSWMHPHLSAPSEKGFIPKNNDELTSEFWQKKAQEYTLQQLRKQENRNVAKNIIMFLGDGMSVPTVAAGESSNISFFTTYKKRS